MNAITELLEELREDEEVEAIIFGPWGWDGYGEPDERPVPEEMQGVILTLDEATPMMQTWSFYGGFGAPDCYAVRIYTNQRILWVTQYDGATGIDHTERNPVEGYVPNMPGG